MARRIPEVLNAEEQAQLLRQPNQKCRTGFRNYCLLKLMLDLGLRASEVLGLKVRDLDWTSGKLMVRAGKGQKDRTLYLNEDDLELLKRWRQVKAGLPASEYLFTTLQGGPIGDRELRYTVKRLAGKAGIEKRVSPHTLRHSFATDLYKDSLHNLRLVQRTLGHQHISTTTIYTHVHDHEVEAALKSFRKNSR